MEPPVRSRQGCIGSAKRTGSNPGRPTVWNGVCRAGRCYDPSAQAGEASTPSELSAPLNPKSKSADTGKDA